MSNAIYIAIISALVVVVIVLNHHFILQGCH